ncbi:hypothetical protein TRIUR3_28584 [Triticum urartu]|uniref:Uncharacterized protein n=1 Tax=Triticum urartu TaxID=4572 RepID=M7YDF0_TRIUA|nr:hypothetical protein TRIUR3_28584 [Triticum urartu]
MEDFPEPLLAEIVKRITQTKALVSLFSRFPNLVKVEIDYSGWKSTDAEQLNNQGLYVLSSHCPSLSDLALSFCSYIDDTGLGYLSDCKKLRSLRLNRAPAVTSTGIFRVAVGCRYLSVLHLVDCKAVDNREWLEYFGRYGSLGELVVKDCDGISQYDLLKFGAGWANLQKFEFEINGDYFMLFARDPSIVSGYPYSYDICCDSLKDLRLAHIITNEEIGLRFLLGKCKALETLYLEYVIGLHENEMISLFQRCSNLKTVALRLRPLRCEDFEYRTALTDASLKALAVSCPMLQVVELTFAFCDPDWPTEIGFTQEGILTLIQSCPIRALLLNGASILYDEGMKCLSSSPLLEKLELVDCCSITDAASVFEFQKNIRFFWLLVQHLRKIVRESTFEKEGYRSAHEDKRGSFLNLCQDNGEMCALTSMHRSAEGSNSSSMPDSTCNVKQYILALPASHRSSRLIEAISAAIAIDDRSEAALQQLRRLLPAVMEARPLLENLLVAAQVLRWRNPPSVQSVPSPN